MVTKDQREMREAFEAWANNEGYDVTRPDIYEHRFLDALYEVWQAAWNEKPMSEQEKLLPCPFCGGEASTISIDGNNYVFCSEHKNRLMCRVAPSTESFLLREDAIRAWNARPQPATDSDVVERVASKLWHSTPSHYDMSWSELVALSKDNLSLMATVSEFLTMAKAAIAAMQPTIDKAVAEERARCERLCSIYFDIAAGAIGEDEVRRLRDKAIEQGGGDASV